MSTPSSSDRVTGLLRLEVDDSIELQCPSCIGPSRHIFTDRKFCLQRPANAITVSEVMDAIKTEFHMVGDYKMFLDNFYLLPSTSAEVFGDYDGHIRIARNLDCPVRITEEVFSDSSLTFYLNSPMRTSTPIGGVSSGYCSSAVHPELIDADVDHEVRFTLFSTNDKIPSSDDSNEDDTTVYSKGMEDDPEIKAGTSSGRNFEVMETENDTSKSEENNSSTSRRTVIEVEERKNVSEMDQSLNTEDQGSATSSIGATGSYVHMTVSINQMDVAMMNEDWTGSRHFTPLCTSTPLIGTNSINFDLGERVPLDEISNVESSIPVPAGVYQRDSISDTIHNASSSKSDEDSVAAGDTVIPADTDLEEDAEKKGGTLVSSDEELEGVGTTTHLPETTADFSSDTGTGVNTSSGTSSTSEMIQSSNSSNSSSASAVTDNCFIELTDSFSGSTQEEKVDSAGNELETAGGSKRKSSLFPNSEYNDNESDCVSSTSCSTPSKKSKRDSQELSTDSSGGSSDTVEMSEPSQTSVITEDQVSLDPVIGEGAAVIQNAHLEEDGGSKAGTSASSDEELEGVGSITRVSGTTADFSSGTGTGTNTNTTSDTSDKSEIIQPSIFPNSTSASAETDNCFKELTDPLSSSELEESIHSAGNELDTAGGSKSKSSLLPESECDDNESDWDTLCSSELKNSKRDSQEHPTDSIRGSPASVEMVESSQKSVVTEDQMPLDPVIGDGAEVIKIYGDLEDDVESQAGTSTPSDKELEGVGTTTCVSGSTADFSSGTSTGTLSLNESETFLPFGSSNSTPASAVTDNCLNELTDPFSSSALEESVNSTGNEQETAGGRKRKSSLIPDTELDNNEGDWDASSTPSKKSKRDDQSQQLPADSTGGSSDSVEMPQPSQKRVVTVDQITLDSVNGDGGSSSWSTISWSTSSASSTSATTAASPVISPRLGTPMPKVGKQYVTDDDGWLPVHSLRQQLLPSGSYIKFEYAVANTNDGSLAKLVPVVLVVQEFTDEGVRGKVIHEDDDNVWVENRYFEFSKIRNPCINNNWPGGKRPMIGL